MRGTFRARIILWTNILIIICYLDASTGFPAEQPTKFNLGTLEAENTKSTTSRPLSRLELGRDLLGRFWDAIRIGTGRFVNSATVARNILVDQAELLASESQNNAAATIEAKTNVKNQGRRSLESVQIPPNEAISPSGTVHLETENAQGLFERPLQISGVFENLLNPTPLLDGIKEEEKYGNMGDKFIGIGRALIGGFEGFSNFLNAVLDLPRNVVHNTSRGITSALNHVGGRIIGLE